MKKIKLIAFVLAITTLISCIKDDSAVKTTPQLTTSPITNVTLNSASSGGNITDDGGETVISRGIVWNTSPSPTIDLPTKINNGNGIGFFYSSISNLTQNTTYYIRAYATNKIGTSYGNEISFITPNVNLDSALVAYYPFNGNSNDESGNLNNGIIKGDVVLTADKFGNAGSAYSFPGNSNSYIDCGSKTSLQIIGALSLSAWIYMDGGFYNPRILQYGGGTTGGYTAFVDGTSNTNRILHATNYNSNFGGGAGTGFCCSSDKGFLIKSLEWHHIIYTADSNGLAKVYIDGNIVGTVQGAPVTNIAYVNSLNIGRNPFSAFDAWGGKLDEIRIYNRVLNSDEVMYLASN
ncbi:LamG-like jellyroll fold domain-containing protein [Flavobacterium sp. W22_SRS_FP1]|uniref:LamG-like jellyroll fold domain-containing protein n=1 Tax=Flavobacterium sp. W22_SRS_FP1 TaxID=3240276 RepID=UPI003F8F0724